MESDRISLRQIHEIKLRHKTENEEEHTINVENPDFRDKRLLKSKNSMETIFPVEGDDARWVDHSKIGRSYSIQRKSRFNDRRGVEINGREIARSTIWMHLAKNFYFSVAKETTSFPLWEKLQAVYEKKALIFEIDFDQTTFQHEDERDRSGNLPHQHLQPGVVRTLLTRD